MSLVSWSQELSFFDYLNISKESLIQALSENDLTYFSSTGEDNEEIIRIIRKDDSNKIYYSVDVSVYFNDSISYRLTFLSTKNKIRQFRKKVGIDKSVTLTFPMMLNYNNNKFFYSERIVNDLIHVEIDNSASFEETGIIAPEKIISAAEREKYIEMLEPEVPKLPKSKKKVMKYIYGAWVAVLVESANDLQITQYRGELLATKNDSLLLLYEGQQTLINFSDIKFLGVYTHDNNPGKYGLYTLAAYSPNIIAAIVRPEYAGNFLALGTPVLFVGLINIFAEVGKRYPVKYYPGDINSINDLNIFSRYPQGMPEKLSSKME
jgi:hypothetical protein